MKKRMTKRTSHVHEVSLGHAKNEGKSIGQSMLMNHKGPVTSGMAARMANLRQMKKHGISLSGGNC